MHHSLFIELKKKLQRNPKIQRVFDREKGELENAEGNKHESIFTFKTTFLECFQTVFYHKQSRALLCLQNKGVAQSILEKFGFYDDYNDKYEKVLAHTDHAGISCSEWDSVKCMKLQGSPEIR